MFSRHSEGSDDEMAQTMHLALFRPNDNENSPNNAKNGKKKSKQWFIPSFGSTTQHHESDPTDHNMLTLAPGSKGEGSGGRCGGLKMHNCVSSPLPLMNGIWYVLFYFYFFALLNIFLQLDSLDYGNYDDQGP